MFLYLEAQGMLGSILGPLTAASDFWKLTHKHTSGAKDIPSI